MPKRKTQPPFWAYSHDGEVFGLGRHSDSEDAFAYAEAALYRFKGRDADLNLLTIRTPDAQHPAFRC